MKTFLDYNLVLLQPGYCNQVLYSTELKTNNIKDQTDLKTNPIYTKNLFPHFRKPFKLTNKST